MTVEAILLLIRALAPLVPGAVVTVQQVIGALKGAGAISDDEVTADFQALIAEVLTRKAMADQAAAGLDPQDPV